MWIFFWGILLTRSSLGLGHKPERKAASGADSPVWSVDLRSVGFTGYAPKQETWGLNLRPNPLYFTDNKVLIATFITREVVTTLARRDQPGESLPLKLHGIFLDADTGKVQVSKEWPITRPRGGVVASGDGRFIVLTPGLVALYSPSLELVKDFKLSPEQQSHLWDFHVSPTGQSILVEYHYPDSSFQWIDAGSLQPQPAWKDLLTHVFIFDNGLAFEQNPNLTSGVSHKVLIRPRDGPERTICRVLTGQVNSSCGDPEFVSDDVLALTMPHGLTLVPKSGGDVLLKASFRDDEWLGHPLHPSADGKRFAATLWEHKGGSALLDIGFHSVLKRIEIYNLPNPHPIYTLDAKQRKIKDVSGVALSPDGYLMAILTDGVVEVYQIPPEHTDTVDLKNGNLHLQVPIPAAKPKP